ncbi:MAG TPA: pitrilysin family protein [Steroidobacteraceae bacterium]|nr:pitrilysin family protein [Steroidobacteraceae bacterium]
MNRLRAAPGWTPTSARAVLAIALSATALRCIGTVAAAPATPAHQPSFAAATASAAPVAATAETDATGVLRATLGNGLRVIIVRNTLAPVVATSVNYLTGSNEAPAGFPGTAHAQEHMMFRGSPGLTADQLADIGNVMGGNFNANTRENLTQYLFTVPAEDLDVALRIEAIRMRDVLDSAADWQQERGAIEQEVAQDLSNPGYVLYSKVRRALFAGTPYANDALGTRPSFQKTTSRMLKRFHADWYAPNNALLVVVGDVDPPGTLAQIGQLFGSIAARKLPPRPRVKLRPPRAASFTVDTDRPNGTQLLAVRVPGLNSPDFPALEVLADVLSSRRFDLYGLVPQGKAVDAEFALDPLPEAGLAYSSVTFLAGDDPRATEAAVRAILAKVAREGVPPELVEAAKLQERSAAQFQKNSISELASIWSDAVALYGLHSPQEDLERIERVTVADVDRVARQYLDLDHAVAAVMLPRGSGKPVAAGAGFGGRESISLGEPHATKLPSWAEAALHRVTVPPSTLHPLVSVLPNGLTLIVQSVDVSDTISVFGHIRNRPETEEPAGREGIQSVLEELLPYGSESLDRVAFEQALDRIGARERAGTDFAVQTLAEHFERGVELLADNELRPALPQAAMKIVQSQVAQGVEARNHSPGYLAQHSLREALFPPNDPSLRTPSARTVGALTLPQIKDYYRLVFRPDLTTIVVIGNVTPERARTAIERSFGAWSASSPRPPTDLPAAPPNRPGVIAVPDDSRVQDLVVLAQNLDLTRTNPDYYALELGNALLGGGFYSTRLSIDLRKNSGLVYSVGSTLQAGRTRGAYLIEFASDPANVSKAANIAMHEIKSMQTAPATADELQRIKAMLIRQIPLGESSVDEIAHGLLDRADIGLPLDEPTIAARRYVELSAQEVQAAFAKWMRPDDLVRVSRGPPPQ